MIDPSSEASQELAELIAGLRTGAPLRIRRPADQELAVVDKAQVVATLREVIPKLRSQPDWRSPLGITATLGTVLAVTDWTQEYFGLSGKWWLVGVAALFVGSLVWLLVAVVRKARAHPPTPEQVYEQIAGDVLVAAPALRRSQPVTELAAGDQVLHPAHGEGTVEAVRAGPLGPMVRIRFVGPPAETIELSASLAQLRLVDPGPL